jgi:hypothetical protein
MESSFIAAASRPFLQILVPINHDVIVTAEEKPQEFFPRE